MELTMGLAPIGAGSLGLNGGGDATTVLPLCVVFELDF